MSASILFGAGGHARVLVDALLTGGADLPIGALTPDQAQWGGDIYGVTVLGADSLLDELIAQKGITHFVVGVGSIKSTALRATLYQNGLRYGLQPLGIKHPSAVISMRASVGLGVQLLASCVVNAGAVILNNVIINTGAIIEHDCQIGEHVHVSPGARLAGGVIVGEGAHVGIGAVIRQGITIGAHAVIGAGAVVVKDVRAGSTVVGVPAKAI